MAIKLASLGVELTLNAAQFVTGFEATRKELKNFNKEVSSSLSELGGVASEALGQLGAFGGEVGMKLEAVGNSAVGLFSAFARLGGPMAAIAGGGAAVAVGLTGISAAALGIAIHAAEAAAKLEDLSHATGVSVETLSRFSIVGKMIAPDVDIDTIAKGLARFERQVLQASYASNSAITPFQRLGIAIKDANGQIRPADDILRDVTQRISTMADGAAKTGIAMEMFGRGGAALIPILSESSDKIDHIIELGQKFGAIITTEDAQAAHKFKENLGELEIAFVGLENQLMRAFLPILQALTKELDDLAEGSSFANSEVLQATDGLGQFRDKASGLAPLIHDIVELVKFWVPWMVDLTAMFAMASEQLSGFLKNLATLLDYQAQFARHPISFSISTLRGGGIFTLTSQIEENNRAANDATEHWKKLADSINNALYAPAKSRTGFDVLDDVKDKLRTFDKEHQKLNLTSPGAHTAELSIQEQIEKLQGQAAAEGLLANSISDVSSATIEATAHANALKLITQLNAQAGKEHVAVTKAQAQAIEEASLRLEAYKESLNVNKQLQEAADKTRIAAESTRALAAAYAQGGSAVAEALEQAKLAPYIEKLHDLQTAYDDMAKSGRFSADQLAILASALDQAKGKMEAQATALHLETLAKYDEEIAKQNFELRGSIPLLENLDDAYLQNEEAVREAKVALEQYNWEVSHPGATDAQREAQRQMFEERSRQAHDSRIAEEGAQYSLQRILADTNSRYAAIREEIEAGGQSTLLVDAAIYDANDRLLRQWDEAAMKVGTLQERFTSFFNELILQGENFGAKFASSILQGIDTLETEFAKAVTGQKTNFAQVGRQVEEQIAKASFQAVIGKAAGALEDKLGIKLPGLHPKPDGTESNPLHVKLVGAAGFGTTAAQPAGDILSSLHLGKAPGFLASLFGGGTGGGAAAGGGGGFVNTMAGLLSVFGGFLADGGDMEPGKWYVTGERHPEIIAPKRPMSVYASMPAMDGTYGGGGAPPVFNFHGVTDGDSFKRSEAQMAGWYSRTLNSARRNG